MSELLTQTAMRELIARWLADGKRVAGPRFVGAKNNLLQYAWLSTADQLELDSAAYPTNSIKAFVFPRHEVLYG